MSSQKKNGMVTKDIIVCFRFTLSPPDFHWFVGHSRNRNSVFESDEITWLCGTEIEKTLFSYLSGKDQVSFLIAIFNKSKEISENKKFGYKNGKIDSLFPCFSPPIL